MALIFPFEFPSFQFRFQWWAKKHLLCECELDLILFFIFILLPTVETKKKNTHSHRLKRYSCKTLRMIRRIEKPARKKCSEKKEKTLAKPFVGSFFFPTFSFSSIKFFAINVVCDLRIESFIFQSLRHSFFSSFSSCMLTEFVHKQ